MMKKRYVVALAAAVYLIWSYFYVPTPTVISVRIGQTFEEVVSGSSFLVMNSSNIPTQDTVGFGATWVKEPAVIIHFNDPLHGFTLPPTTFAAIGYMHNKVDTITTSPMLKKLTFNQAIAELALLQRQFQEGGWQLENETTWYDLTSEGREKLYKHVRLESNGFMKTTLLVAPKKYAMTFRLWCAARCDSRIGLDRYLIDIGIGEDINFQVKERERQ